MPRLEGRRDTPPRVARRIPRRNHPRGSRFSAARLALALRWVRSAYATIDFEIAENEPKLFTMFPGSYIFIRVCEHECSVAVPYARRKFPGVIKRRIYGIERRMIEARQRDLYTPTRLGRWIFIYGEVGVLWRISLRMEREFDLLILNGVRCNLLRKVSLSY